MSDKLHSLELALDTLPAEHRDEVKRILYGNPCECVGVIDRAIDRAIDQAMG